MTTAGELRELLATDYRLDEDRGVLVRADAQPFAYSDGTQSEAYLLQVMRETADVAVGSAELAARIRDWPSRYHLGPARQNLLRPIEGAIAGAVLEVGAGCGAITRQLGETGATVLAVEGSLERATIAALRCRGLPNVVIVCDNFANVRLPVRFELVTLVGVLEYSRMFLEGDDPVQQMLGRAAAALSETGLLALAIENQLGLKYLAGAREDHLDVQYAGVIGNYGAKTPVTFGERELRERLARAGFGLVQGLYPFPDYKEPAVLITESGWAEPRLNACDLVATSMRRHDPSTGPYRFSETLARDVFVKNGLGSASANSFFFLAGRGEGARARMPNSSVLAFAYSTDRARAFAKEMRTVRTSGGLKVVRRALYRAAAPQDAPNRQRLEDEDYIEGEILHRGLERIVANPGWTVADVARWIRPLADYLRGRAVGGKLAPSLLDCTPFNVIRRAGDGALVAFDLEWEPAGGEAQAVERVLFRGLWNSIARVDDAADPAPGTPTDVCSLMQATMAALGYEVSDAQALEWIRGEHANSGTVSGLGMDVPDAIPRFPMGGLPAPEFRVQVYYRAADEGYAEANSVFGNEVAMNRRIAARLALPRRDKPYARLRLDPLAAPGLVRIERVALIDAQESVLWETRLCRAPDFEGVNGFLDLSQMLPLAQGTCWLSGGLDPHFDLAIPADTLARLDMGGAVIVEMSLADAGQRAAVAGLGARP
jgi:precorrin-6B methylase 2